MKEKLSLEVSFLSGSLIIGKLLYIMTSNLSLKKLLLICGCTYLAKYNSIYVSFSVGIGWPERGDMPANCYGLLRSFCLYNLCGSQVGAMVHGGVMTSICTTPLKKWRTRYPGGPSLKERQLFCLNKDLGV